jgi:hypothetical protein
MLLLLLPPLIGGNTDEEACTIKSHQNCGIDFFCLSTARYDTIVTMPIASIPCAQLSIRSTAARCEQPESLSVPGVEVAAPGLWTLIG